MKIEEQTKPADHYRRLSLNVCPPDTCAGTPHRAEICMFFGSMASLEDAPGAGRAGDDGVDRGMETSLGTLYGFPKFFSHRHTDGQDRETGRPGGGRREEMDVYPLWTWQSGAIKTDKPNRLKSANRRKWPARSGIRRVGKYIDGPDISHVPGRAG